MVFTSLLGIANTKMGIPDWVIGYIAAIVFLGLYLLWRRHLKHQVTESNSKDELERRTARTSALVSILAGASFLIAMLFSWSRVPAGNEVFVYSFASFGALSVIYGFFKLYRLKLR